jgi:hypothetical protein
MQNRKEKLLESLNRWIAQRPGLDFANYGEVSCYRSEMRSITKDRHHAEALLAAVSWREITADSIIEASKHAFSGRLTIEETPNGFSIQYCTGQYFPTEYRRAVCAVLSSALWHYWRESETFGDDCGADYIRQTAKKELGRSLASRWFN